MCRLRAAEEVQPDALGVAAQHAGAASFADVRVDDRWEGVWWHTGTAAAEAAIICKPPSEGDEFPRAASGTTLWYHRIASRCGITVPNVCYGEKARRWGCCVVEFSNAWPRR